MIAVGKTVKIKKQYQADFDDFGDEELVVKDVATSSEEHKGYDESMEGMPLYTLKFKNEDFDFPYALYENTLEVIQ